MTPAAVITARMEAERFLKKLAEYEETDNFKGLISDIHPCKERAAVKRASMDLSRALSDLRR